MQRVKLTKTEVYQCLQHQRYKFYELLSRTAKPRKFTLKVTLYGDYFFSAGKSEWTLKPPNEVSHWHYSFSMTQKELESSLGVDNLFAEENIDWKQFVLDELAIQVAKEVLRNATATQSVDTWIEEQDAFADALFDDWLDLEFADDFQGEIDDADQASDYFEDYFEDYVESLSDPQSPHLEP